MWKLEYLGVMVIMMYYVFSYNGKETWTRLRKAGAPLCLAVDVCVILKHSWNHSIVLMPLSCSLC